MESTLGLLFKKRYIDFEDEKFEIYIFKDVVMGITFINKNEKRVCNIATGDFAGIYATVFEEADDNCEDVIILKSLENAVKRIDNRVNFEKIRKHYTSDITQYYTKSKKKNLYLDPIVNKSLIKKIDETFKERSSDYDEDEFDQSTDISKMYTTIKKTIISQDEQIMQILTALFKNQKVVNSEMDIDLIAKLKENLLIFGSTGTGKTEILKRISRIYNIPIVIEDATSLSETGYQGRNITNMLEDLYSASGEKISDAEKGILVIDEFDKLAEKDGDSGSHVSRLGVQRGLLKLLDGSEFYFDNKKFNTSKLTIVGLGAFTGIVKDNQEKSIGFGSVNNNVFDVDNYKNIATKDFIDYGIIRELIGRFSKFVAMNPLSQEDIFKILTESDFSPLNTYKQLFDMMNVEFEYNEEFVDWFALKTVGLNSGARCLKTVFDECISGAMFKVLAGEYSKISLIKPQENGERPYILTKIKK